MVLIDDGFAQADLACVCPEDQIPQGINAHAIHALERQGDRPGIGAGGDHEVVFQLPLVAVIDEGHAGVDLLVFHLRVRGNVGPPPGRIIADEGVHLAGEFPEPGHLRRGVGPDEPHAQQCIRLGLRLPQGEHSLGGSQEEGVPPAARQKLDLTVGLALIGLEG